MRPLAVLLLSLACVAAEKSDPSDVQLRVIPENVYKTNDPGHRGTESWYYRLVIIDPTDHAWIPKQAVIELFHGSALLETETISEEMLSSRKKLSFRAAPDTPAASAARGFQLPEAFDLWFAHSYPTSLGVDRMHVKLTLEGSEAKTLVRDLDIPVSHYQQKTKLVFPFVGTGLVTQGTINDSGHNAFSNQYAIDVIGLTQLYAPETCNEDLNPCYAGWGRDVIAPADGVVVYARNDVPNNPAPGEPDAKMLGNLHDPVDAVAGNCVIIDHGNSEYSVVMHLQQGSITVKANDKVKQGQVIAKLGNSGDAYGPHLHFQLQPGPKLFQSASMPAQFENVRSNALVRGNYFKAK